MTRQPSVLLIPQIEVTSKLAGRSWHVLTGTFSWIGWNSRERPAPIYGEFNSSGVHQYSAGRITFQPRGIDDDEAVTITLHALTGLLGVANDFWGEQLTAVPIPPRLLTSEALFVEDMVEGLDADAPEFIDTVVQLGATASVDNEVPEWALDRMNVALSNLTDLVPALAYIFESRKEFHFLGDDIAIVQSEPNSVPPSSAATRMETSFHNAYKAMEALLGGEPPKDPRKLRERLKSRSIDPDQVVGFAGLREDMLTRVTRLQATRDKRAAHAGPTGVKSRAITYFELMDAQYAAATAIRRRIEALRVAASGKDSN